MRLETAERELNSKVNALSHELDIANSQLKELRGTYKSLDTHKYAQEKSLTEYTIKYEGLQKQLEDKEQIISKLTGLIDSGKEQKASSLPNNCSGTTGREFEDLQG